MRDDLTPRAFNMLVRRYSLESRDQRLKRLTSRRDEITKQVDGIRNKLGAQQSAPSGTVPAEELARGENMLAKTEEKLEICKRTWARIFTQRTSPPLPS